jgi:hypothetical protein
LHSALGAGYPWFSRDRAPSEALPGSGCPTARHAARNCGYTSPQRGRGTPGLTRSPHPASSGAKLLGPAPKNFGSRTSVLRGASFRRYPLPDRARRSLKTQQHAHLSTQSGRRCASRFDPSGSIRDREGLRKNIPSFLGALRVLGAPHEI